MYVGGEIADLARIGRPEIGVVTAVQPVHLSRIGTIEAIEQAKGELVEALPADGVAILNADDERVRRMARRTRARVVTYGFAADADVRAEDVESRGLRRDALHAGRRRPAAGRSTIPTLGRLAVHNALAAAAVGLAAGHRARRDRRRRSRAGWRAPHRGQVVRAGGVTIVDDTYNASPGVGASRPSSCWPGCRAGAVAVLGEMLELGDGARGRPRARRRGRGGGRRSARRRRRRVPPAIADGAVDGRARRRRGSSRSRDREAALDAPARRACATGDVVLVKASRGIALDLLVDDARAARSGEARADDRRADPGPAPRVRDRRDPDAAVHPAAPGDRVHEADPDRGAGQPPGQARHADDGRRCSIIAVVLALYLLLRWPPEGGIFAPLAALAGVGLLGAFDDYLNAKTGEGIQRPPEAHLAGRLRVRRRVPDPADLRDRPDRRAVRRRRCSIEPAVYVALRGVRDHRRQQRREHHRRPRRPRRRDARLRVRGVPAGRPPQRARPSRTWRSCARSIIGALLGFLWFNVHPAQIFMGDSGSLSLGATLAVIALITGQILVLPLIGLIFVIETASVIIQVGYFKLTRRQAALPDEPAPPPLRAGRLGRGEDHAPVLDRRDPRRRCSA